MISFLHMTFLHLNNTAQIRNHSIFLAQFARWVLKGALFIYCEDIYVQCFKLHWSLSNLFTTVTWFDPIFLVLSSSLWPIFVIVYECISFSCRFSSYLNLELYSSFSMVFFYNSLIKYPFLPGTSHVNTLLYIIIIS